MFQTTSGTQVIYMLKENDGSRKLAKIAYNQTSEKHGGAKSKLRLPCAAGAQSLPAPGVVVPSNPDCPVLFMAQSCGNNGSSGVAVAPT